MINEIEAVMISLFRPFAVNLQRYGQNLGY